jgi:prepilin-type N-terminal cleavage/methylation domain-containing protein
MNNKGFTLIETIIAVVILSGALILLYTSFTKLLQSEKKRIEYDDVAFIYRTYYVKNYLKNGSYINEGGGSSAINVIDSAINLFNSSGNEDLNVIKIDTSNLPRDFGIDEEDYALLIRKSSISTILNPNSDIEACTTKENCEPINDEDLNMYLHSLNIDITCNYVFVTRYKLDNKYYYSWVGVN